MPSLDKALEYHKCKIRGEAIKIANLRKFTEDKKRIWLISYEHHQCGIRKFLATLKNIQLESINFNILAADYTPRNNWRTKTPIDYENIYMGSTALVQAVKVDPKDLPLYLSWEFVTKRLDKFYV